MSEHTDTVGLPERPQEKRHRNGLSYQGKPLDIPAAKLQGRDLEAGLVKRLRYLEFSFAAAAYGEGWEVVSNYAWVEPEKFVDDTARTFLLKLFEYEGDALRAGFETQTAIKLMNRDQEQWQMINRLDVYAESIVKTRRSLQIAQGMKGAVGYLYGDDPDGALEVLRQVEDGDTAPAASTVLDSGDLHLKMTAALDNGFDGFSTRIPELDRHIKKLVIGDATIIASRTSLGKTTLALQIARNVAYAGERVLIISTEMQAHLLWLKMAAGIAMLDSGRVIEGTLTQEEQEELAVASEQLADRVQGKLYIDDTARTLPQILRVVSQLKPRLVIIDLLDDLCKTGDSKNQSLELGRTFVALREMGKKYGHHTMIVHQIRREAEDGDNPPPTLRDLRWSGDLEQKTDNAIFIHRLQIKDAAPSLTLFPSELWVRKCRFGAKDVKTGVLFSATAQWFFDNPQDPTLVEVMEKEAKAAGKPPSAPAQRVVKK